MVGQNKAKFSGTEGLGATNPSFQQDESSQDNISKFESTQPQYKSPKLKRGGKDLIYAIEDYPPWYLWVFLGLQHYLTMFGSTTIVPLLVTPAMCVPDTHPAKGEIISTIFFVSGLITLLQTSFGIRLPIVQGATFAFLAPTFAILSLPQWKCPSAEEIEVLYNESNGTFDVGELWKPRMREIQGAIIVASLFQVVIGFTGIVGLLLRYIGPLAIAPCVSLIGLALFEAAGNFASKHWGISFFTMALITLFSQFLRDIYFPCVGCDKGKCFRMDLPCLKMFSVILSIMIVWAFCAILTETGVFGDTKEKSGYYARTDLRSSVLRDTAWVRFPYPGQWGTPTISTAGVIGMLAGVLASMLESIGDYYACARLSGAPPPPTHAINRGIMMEGFGCILAGLWGTSNGTTSYSENIGAIGITKIGSRIVVQTAAVLCIFLGIFSKLGALFVTMPDPIIGGVFCCMFGMIAAVGISNLQHVDMNSSRNMFIFGLALFMGLVLPSWLKTNPGVIQTGSPAVDQIITVLLSTGMFVGGVIGFVLDNTIPGTIEERGLTAVRGQAQASNKQSKDDKEAIHNSYDFPCCMPCVRKVRCFKYLPFCPTFNVISPFHRCCNRRRSKKEEELEVTTQL